MGIRAVRQDEVAHDGIVGRGQRVIMEFAGDERVLLPTVGADAVQTPLLQHDARLNQVHTRHLPIKSSIKPRSTDRPLSAPPSAMAMSRNMGA